MANKNSKLLRLDDICAKHCFKKSGCCKCIFNYDIENDMFESESRCLLGQIRETLEDLRITTWEERNDI